MVASIHNKLSNWLHKDVFYGKKYDKWYTCLTLLVLSFDEVFAANMCLFGRLPLIHAAGKHNSNHGRRTCYVFGVEISTYFAFIEDTGKNCKVKWKLRPNKILSTEVPKSALQTFWQCPQKQSWKETKLKASEKSTLNHKRDGDPFPQLASKNNGKSTIISNDITLYRK